MKNIYIALLLIGLLAASCGEDRRTEYIEKTATNRAIESIMRQNYYWYEDIPSSKSLNFFAKPHSTFLKSLLSKKESGYSYLEDVTDTESLKSYGITFNTGITYNNDLDYAVRVLYVDSDSPAADAGLKRGDWIIKIDGTSITKKLIDALYQGDAISLTLGEYEEVPDENGLPKTNFKETETLQLSAARITTDNPIHFSAIYASSTKKVAYLAYKSFTSGESNSLETYNNTLRALSNTFKSQEVTDFILDLRYNGGSDLKAAQVLGSILVPQEALGSTMCYLTYNDLQADKNEEWFFSNEALGSGSNLNLKRLYIITGSGTAATSDVLINTLKPYIDEIVLVGQSTKGNHTYTHPYESEELYPYILHPVDCMISNAENYTPGSGLSATHTLNELNFNLFPFGDQNEVLLYSTLYLIETGSMPTFNATSASLSFKKLAEE